MRSILAVGLLSAFTSVAHALPVTWYLQDVTFSDGGTAAGSFVYDADSNVYSNIQVTTTAGTLVNGAYFEYSTFSGIDQAVFTEVPISSNLTGTHWLSLDFSESLTNDDLDVVFLSYGFEYIFETADFQTGEPDRVISSGYITSVPVPAAAWLFGSALAGLGWMRRKQTI